MLATCLGTWVLAYCGAFSRKALPARQVVPLALAFTGYAVSWDLCLRLCPGGVYQLARLLVTPAVLVGEAFVSNRLPSVPERMAVGALCVGVRPASEAGSTAPSLSLTDPGPAADDPDQCW